MQKEPAKLENSTLF